MNTTVEQTRGVIPLERAAQSAVPDEHLEQTLPALLALRARETPEQVALREKRLGIWREISWAEYHRNVQATAHMLHVLSVRSGDHVAILSDNRPEWIYVDRGGAAGDRRRGAAVRGARGGGGGDCRAALP